MTEEEKKEMVEGEKEEEVYSEEGRELKTEEGAIDEVEEGFMQGYEEGKKMAKCAKCGKVFEKDFVEKEIDGKIYRFCSNECAEKFKK